MGGGGGGGRTPGIYRVKHTFKGGSIGGIPPEKDQLIYPVVQIFSVARLQLLGHSYILSPFHPYIAFMPVYTIPHVHEYNKCLLGRCSEHLWGEPEC